MRTFFYILFIVLLAQAGFAQLPETKWTVSNQNLAFLKNEISIKLEFRPDTFLMDSLPTEYSLSSKASLHDSLKKIFIKRINKVFRDKVFFSDNLTTGSYNYILKVTPLNYNTVSFTTANYTNGVGYNRPGECHYKELFGTYTFEILSVSEEKLCVIHLENIRNSVPAYSSCEPDWERISKTINKNLYSNAARAGTEFGGYLYKLIKKSPK